jgi:hypothetical protein
MTGVEIYRQDMLDALWGLREGTRNSSKLKKGYHVIFYLAGREGQSSLGTCILNSGFYKFVGKERERRRLHELSGFYVAVGLPCTVSASFMILSLMVLIRLEWASIFGLFELARSSK